MSNTINEQIAAADNWRKAVELAALTLGIAKDSDQYFTIMVLGRSCYQTGQIDALSSIKITMNDTFSSIRHDYPVATGGDIEP